MNASYSLLDHISTKIFSSIKQQHPKQCILFLDIDGTLAEFQLNPEHSFIPATTLHTLKQLTQYCTVYLVTGRSVQQARSMIGSIKCHIIGSHGAEYYNSATGQMHIAQPLRQLKPLKQQLQQDVFNTLPIRIELKPYSVALHYRECPEYEHQIQALAENYCQKFPEFTIQSGKFVCEIIAQNIQKGSAIERVFKQASSQYLYPIFIGDDLTDESGFEVINRFDGLSIKVGEGQTQAIERLQDILEVAHFLKLFLALLEKLQQGLAGEFSCQN